MKDHDLSLSRRTFLQGSGALGVGALLFRTPLLAEGALAPKVEKRKFGKTGVEVSHVGLGCMFDIINNQVILRTAYDHGVTYWDTAAGYERWAAAMEPTLKRLLSE